MLKWKENPKMWSKMGAGYASGSAFWLHSHKKKFLIYMQPLSRAPAGNFGKYIRICQCVWTCQTVSLMVFFISFAWCCKFLCLQNSKSPQIPRGHFLLQNTYQLVAYYWLDGNSYWQWHWTRTLASLECKDHEKVTLLSFIYFWRVIHNFQDSFLLKPFKMSACWQR